MKDNTAQMSNNALPMILFAQTQGFQSVIRLMDVHAIAVKHNILVMFAKYLFLAIILTFSVLTIHQS